MAQKPVLGKGLASLLPGAGMPAALLTEGPVGAVAAGEPTTVQQQEYANRDRHLGISMALIDEIFVNPYQPRRDFDDQGLEELAQSIQANGIIQPLVVRKLNHGYQLIAGERRLRAAKKVGLKQVPIVIRKSTDREALELALVENIQREDLNCIDEALAYFQLMQDFSLTQEEIAQQAGKDRATVANFLRLLRLPEAIIDDLRRQILTLGHGKALLSVDDNEFRLRLRAQIVEKKLSVRETEALIDQFKSSTSAATTPINFSKEMPAPSRMTHLAEDLMRHLMTRVDFRGTERRGKIVIHYASRQELDRILQELHV